ncbi:MAG: DUF6320 domain-containing protein [Clostridiales bacterium]|nr:DUF6320 domain-containing protein [Clostridiales bacterium]
MNKCEKCNVLIYDDTDTCPLCRHVLKKDGTERKNTYPDAIRVTRKFRFIENLVLFLSLVAAVASVWVNLLVNEQFGWHFLWCLIVILGLIYANVALRLAVMGRPGYMFKAISLVILAIMFLVGLDYLTGYRGWALDYVFPGGILLVDVAIVVLMIVNHRSWQSYMMTEIFTIILSIIPVILLAVGIIKFPYLALIALTASVFLFLGTLILGDQRARDEMYRRFHV